MTTRTLHRIILIVPLVALLLGVAFVAATVLRILAIGLDAVPPPSVMFAGALAWLAFIAPLLWTASRHARRLAYSEATIDVGLREVWRIAMDRDPHDSTIAPQISKLDHRRALRSAVLQATFAGFLSTSAFILPELRNLFTALWAAAFMALVGGGGYNLRLARDFLRRDPATPIRWNHQYFDLTRYEPSGVPFVRRARIFSRASLAWGVLGAFLFMRIVAA